MTANPTPLTFREFSLIAHATRWYMLTCKQWWDTRRSHLLRDLYVEVIDGYLVEPKSLEDLKEMFGRYRRLTQKDQDLLYLLWRAFEQARDAIEVLRGKSTQGGTDDKQQ